jgi:endonuclease-3
MRETKSQRSERALKVVDTLSAAMPDAKIELHYSTPWELLVAVILSAQSTDRRVNMIAPDLHRALTGPAACAASKPEEVEMYIKTLGLFRNKAKNLVELAKVLMKMHGGKVPTSRAMLAELPGVGNKTAGVVSMHLGGDHAFPVDTHVMRLSARLGFTKETKPDAVEADLRDLLPQASWFIGHQLLVWHGRRVCHAIKPECHRCCVAHLCPKVGVSTAKRATPRSSQAART